MGYVEACGRILNKPDKSEKKKEQVRMSSVACCTLLVPSPSQEKVVSDELFSKSVISEARANKLIAVLSAKTSFSDRYVYRRDVDGVTVFSERVQDKKKKEDGEQFSRQVLIANPELQQQIDAIVIPETADEIKKLMSEEANVLQWVKFNRIGFVHMFRTLNESITSTDGHSRVSCDVELDLEPSPSYKGGPLRNFSVGFDFTQSATPPSYISEMVSEAIESETANPSFRTGKFTWTVEYYDKFDLTVSEPYTSSFLGTNEEVEEE